MLFFVCYYLLFNFVSYKLKEILIKEFASMKNKMLSFFRITFVLSTILLISSSCTKDKWYENSDNTDVWVSYITIRNTDWTWNNDKSRYEVLSDLNISQKYYNNSVINASVFLYEENIEVQTPLPYVRTWTDDANQRAYTETLSYDVSYADQSIAFYIQSSDLGRDDSVLPSSYKIKYSFIYQNK